MGHESQNHANAKIVHKERQRAQESASREALWLSHGPPMLSNLEETVKIVGAQFGAHFANDWYHSVAVTRACKSAEARRNTSLIALGNSSSQTVPLP